MFSKFLIRSAIGRYPIPLHTLPSHFNKTMMKVFSYQIADSIDIKVFKTAFKAELYYSDSEELFYRMDTDQFIYVFKYGVVCFLNYDSIRITSFLQLIEPYCRNLFETSLSEEFQIETGAAEYKLGY